MMRLAPSLCSLPQLFAHRQEEPKRWSHVEREETPCAGEPLPFSAHREASPPNSRGKATASLPGHSPKCRCHRSQGKPMDFQNASILLCCPLAKCPAGALLTAKCLVSSRFLHGSSQLRDGGTHISTFPPALEFLQKCFQMFHPEKLTSEA